MPRTSFGMLLGSRLVATQTGQSFGFFIDRRAKPSIISSSKREASLLLPSIYYPLCFGISPGK